MPTYDYVCNGCGHQVEIFHSITEPARTECPACHEQTLKRKLGTGGGLIFKGSGFYTTDYRSEGYKKSASADSKPAAGESSSSGSSGDKSSSGGESKSTGSGGESKSSGSSDSSGSSSGSSSTSSSTD